MAACGWTAEDWRPYFTQAIPDPHIVDFVIEWLRQESGGNPCDYTSYHESGIAQLMPPQDTDLANTTEALLRTACIAGTTQCDHDLTPDEINVQVNSTVDYVNALRAKAHQLLQNVGTDWDESTPDFWSLVKLLHSLPSLTNYLPNAAQALNRGPANWNEFVQYVPQNQKYDHWLGVSASVGSFGAGAGSGIFGTSNRTWLLVGALLLGAFAGAWFYQRRKNYGFLTRVAEAA